VAQDKSKLTLDCEVIRISKQFCDHTGPLFVDRTNLMTAVKRYNLSASDTIEAIIVQSHRLVTCRDDWAQCVVDIHNHRVYQCLSGLETRKILRGNWEWFPSPSVYGVWPQTQFGDT